MCMTVVGADVYHFFPPCSCIHMKKKRTKETVYYIRYNNQKLDAFRFILKYLKN
jgi:hypothetical protein